MEALYTLNFPPVVSFNLGLGFRAFLNPKLGTLHPKTLNPKP